MFNIFQWGKRKSPTDDVHDEEPSSKKNRLTFGCGEDEVKIFSHESGEDTRDDFDDSSDENLVDRASENSQGLYRPSPYSLSTGDLPKYVSCGMNTEETGDVRLDQNCTSEPVPSGSSHTIPEGILESLCRHVCQSCGNMTTHNISIQPSKSLISVTPQYNRPSARPSTTDSPRASRNRSQSKSKTRYKKSPRRSTQISKEASKRSLVSTPRKSKSRVRSSTTNHSPSTSRSVSDASQKRRYTRRTRPSTTDHSPSSSRNINRSKSNIEARLSREHSCSYCMGRKESLVQKSRKASKRKVSETSRKSKSRIHPSTTDLSPNTSRRVSETSRKSKSRIRPSTTDLSPNTSRSRTLSSSKSKTSNKVAAKKRSRTPTSKSEGCNSCSKCKARKKNDSSPTEMFKRLIDLVLKQIKIKGKNNKK